MEMLCIHCCFSINITITNSYKQHCLLSQPSFHNTRLSFHNWNWTYYLIQCIKCACRSSMKIILAKVTSYRSQTTNIISVTTATSIGRKDSHWYFQYCSIYLCHTGKSYDFLTVSHQISLDTYYSSTVI